MIFRMEDLDPARSKLEYAKSLADDLRWLGLDWDDGWPNPSFSQSKRTDLYQEAFHTLEQQRLIYPCYCSRAQRLAASAPHPGEEHWESGCSCRYLTAAQRAELETAGRRPAWKIKVPDQTITVTDEHYGAFSQTLQSDVGDFIIRRADGVFAYQLAVSVDDMAMGVTRVVRGHDLLSSAPRQAWLIRTLGGVPPAYCHGPLLVSPNGKLSKRLGSLSTQVLRQTYTPEALIGFLAYTVGLLPKPEPITARELICLFSWDKIPHRDIFLEDKVMTQQPTNRPV